MKTVILAGGLGSRISEESHLRPKPMIEIGGSPILWHVMKIYSSQGFNDFIICCGYKGYVIKEWFANYYLHRSDVTFDFRNQNEMTVHHNVAEPWRVTLVDTGSETMTGGRVARVEPYLKGERFMMTYGDGLSDVKLANLLDMHETSGGFATLTSVQPAGRWGSLGIAPGGRVESFQEKIKGDGGWINGGFFVLEPDIFQYIKEGDATVWEREPLEGLAADNKLSAYQHHGFWQPMDTLRDKVTLEQLWATDSAPWKLW